MSVQIIASPMGADRFINNFYKMSRKNGTVVGLKFTRTQSIGHDVVVVASYTHTCINEGAKYSDARKAVVRAMEGKTDLAYEFTVTRAHWVET